MASHCDFGWASVVILFALVAGAEHEDHLRRSDVEAKDVPCRAEWGDEFAQRWACAHLAIAVGRRREAAVGHRANDLDSLAGTHGPLDRLGWLEQEVEETIQIGICFSGELDPDAVFMLIVLPHYIVKRWCAGWRRNGNTLDAGR
jgi:hypothetical protein